MRNCFNEGIYNNKEIKENYSSSDNPHVYLDF